jgi:hypothetical protein
MPWWQMPKCYGHMKSNVKLSCVVYDEIVHQGSEYLNLGQS